MERYRFYGNDDTGCQISRTDDATSIADWPSRNLVLGCESYDNRDPLENNADGFAAKLTSGEGNIFRDCVSHNNIDDGWDLYTKAGTGPIGAVFIERSRDNGALSSGGASRGDKNGFKLGGEGIVEGYFFDGAFSRDAKGIILTRADFDRSVENYLRSR